MGRTSVTQALAVVLHDLARVFRARGPAAAGVDPLSPTDLDVMRRVVHHPGSRVSDVADALGLAANNVSTSVRSLAARGLLAREPDPGDRRAVRLCPTAQALADRDAVEAAWGDLVESAMAQLDDRQQRALEDAVDALRALSDRLESVRRAGSA
jgi:DNA-binding MarR family transcriptional regulator